MQDSVKRRRKRLWLFVGLYLLIALLGYWIVYEDWQRTAVSTESVTMGYLLPAEGKVEQAFISQMDILEEVTLTPHFDAAERPGTIGLTISRQGNTLWAGEVAANELISDQPNQIRLDNAISGAKGKELVLSIDPNGTGLALWAGNTMSAGKFDVAVQTGGLLVNDAVAQGSLVMTTQGCDLMNAHGWYWPAALTLLAALLLLIWISVRQNRQGKHTFLIRVIILVKQYGYLLKQLVWRDFRVKYKSSALGMVWSFLNPLLTMLVYYFVFSTIFRSNLEHFPVYLMSGIVLFSYFSEGTNLGLISITSNSSLITKVYMPKLIYPLSKIISSAINLCISMIPLFLVMIISGVPFYKSLLLLPVVILFLMIFTFGMSLLLCTLNVFFRDTQFLWSVILTMLNFLTPVFYPESIIPAEFITLYHMNPMYQILYFMRTIVIGGVSPTPVTYLYCTLASVVPLILGLWVFRKNQDKFVLHL